MELRPAVFLDRDGVLNEPIVKAGLPNPPSGVADLRIASGAIDACRRLSEAGLFLVVATNQPDIARGTQTREVLDAIHDALRRKMHLDAVLVCPHDDEDRCECRKPAPGLLLEGARRWHLDLERSVMVGDRWRDVEAGRAAGCATVLVDRAYHEPRLSADLVVGSLDQAVPWILERAGSRIVKEVIS
ncbi:MAG: HAD family hydrolase [Candidatus Dormibacteraeota bacterium]|nr:HAD family hydrolase [Candidatus Dormibacteraeota bacterium]